MSSAPGEEDLLLAFRVPVFKRRAKRLLTSHPKFYYFDTGVYRSLRPRGILDAPGEIGGPALEGLVAQHLRAWIDYRPGRAELFYWRTKSGVEVDFIVYGDDVFRAFEVKSSSSVSKRDLRGLNNFLEDYPEAGACFIYGGTEKLRIGHVDRIPVDTFLETLVP